LLRLLFVAPLAIGLEAGVSSGVPYAYATLVQPVQTNTNQITVLNSKVDNLKISIDSSQLAQDNRRTTLETNSDSQRQRLDAVESDIASAKSDLAMEQAARTDLASQVADIKAQFSSQASSSAQLRTDLNALKPTTCSATAQVAEMQQQITLLRLQNALLTAHIRVVAQNLGDARTVLTTTVAAMQSFVNTPGVFSADDQASLTVRLVTADVLINVDPHHGPNRP
jgi:chromosome segregation ATPase